MSNREFLFQGKSMDTGKWIEGYGCIHVPGMYLTHIIHKSSMNIHQHSEVVPGTLCQYIGLLVKQEEENGQVSDQKAFEHDIVFNENWTPTTYEIVFEDGEFLLRNETAYAPIEYLKDFVRIGNSIDNPELLNP